MNGNHGLYNIILASLYSKSVPDSVKKLNNFGDFYAYRLNGIKSIKVCISSYYG